MRSQAIYNHPVPSACRVLSEIFSRPVTLRKVWDSFKARETFILELDGPSLFCSLAEIACDDAWEKNGERK